MSTEAKVPLSLVQALAPTAAALGHHSADADRIVPKIDLGLPIREMGMQLGKLLKNCGIYRLGAARTPVAQFGDEGWKEMSAHRFCGWVEEFVACFVQARGKGGRYYEAEASMNKETAAKLLETDAFLVELPIIDRVASVRLPVRMKDGTVQLMKKGYNADHRVWCEDEIAFDENLPLNEAFKFWMEMCGEFEFAEKGPLPRDLYANRNFLVHLSACVGTYCHFLFTPGTTRPIIIYTANDQGSGKSILGCMALSAPFGIGNLTSLPVAKGGFVNDEKLEAMLETVARSRQPYLFLDDAPGGVFSNKLNAFVTEPSHTGRIYGDNSAMFTEPNITQVFITGNNVESSRDVMQRALWCEIFMSTDAEAKKHKVDLTPDFVGLPEQRKRFLEVLWAMCRVWVEAGMPESPTIKRRAPQWSKLVGGILDACNMIGFVVKEGSDEAVAVDPFGVPDLPLAGVRGHDEVRELIVALADRAEEDFEEWMQDDDPEKGPWKNREFNTSDVVQQARDLQVMLDVVGSKDDKPLKGGDLRKLGRRLEKWRGKEDLKTTKGRAFRFGKRRQEHGSIYPIEWISVK